MPSRLTFNSSVWTFESFSLKYLVLHYLDRLAASPQAHPIDISRLSGVHVFYLHIQTEIFLKKQFGGVSLNVFSQFLPSYLGVFPRSSSSLLLDYLCVVVVTAGFLQRLSPAISHL